MLRCYRRGMTEKIKYDIYRGRKDRTLRLATRSGAKLPAHLSPKDWTLIPIENTPVHSDAARDIVAKGCFFQIVD
jgi:hypothetical protein